MTLAGSCSEVILIGLWISLILKVVLTLPQQMVEQHVMETAVSAKDVTLLQAAAVETLALGDLTHSLL